MALLQAVPIVRCEACESVHPVERAESPCTNCGTLLPGALRLPRLDAPAKYVGVLAFLKPLGDHVTSRMKGKGMARDAEAGDAADQVEGPMRCGWCATLHMERPPSSNCPNCGGVLPMPPGNDPGPPPPAAPRPLPSAFLNRIYWRENIGGLTGVGFAAVGLLLLLPVGAFALLMFAFGTLLTYSNFKSARHRHRALQSGNHLIGVIESVTRISGGGGANDGRYSTMYMVYFRFERAGRLLQGMKHTYDPSICKHFIGEPVWVVVDPADPASHDMWPPRA